MKIIRAKSDEDFQAAVKLFRDYANWLGVDLCFQDFEDELIMIKEQYGAPTGALFLIKSGEGYIGCAGIRRLDHNSCELKRMYLQAGYRGKGYGRKLLNTCVKEAKKLGYSFLKLDTIEKLKAAIGLYKATGFREVKPYYHNPLDGVRYFEMDL